jgi:hypothetical protein
MNGRDLPQLHWLRRLVVVIEAGLAVAYYHCEQLVESLRPTHENDTR